MRNMSNYETKLLEKETSWYKFPSPLPRLLYTVADKFEYQAKAFSDSQAAYTSGNGEAAHELSLAGKRHQQLKEQYNDEAASWIFNENNRVQPQGSVDLHGLYVQESIDFTEKAIDVRSTLLPSLSLLT